MPALSLTPADWLAIEREACKRSLATFVQEAWHVIEPGQEYTHGWHIDAICLPADTEIETEAGAKAIGDIVNSRWQGRVMSVNHSNGRLEWRQILCHMRTPGRGLLAFETEAGLKFKATGNHPVFIVGRGYVRADEVAVGDRVVELHPLQVGVQAKAIDEGDVLQSRLPLRAPARGDTGCVNPEMRSLRSEVSPLASEGPGRILFNGMLCRFESEAGSASVPGVRRRKVLGGKEVHEVPGSRTASRKAPSLQELPEACLSVPSTVRRVIADAWSVLRHGLPRCIRAWTEQRGICGWKASWGVWTRLSPNKGEDRKAGRREVLPMRERGNVGRAPHRPEQVEQQVFQPCDALQEVPRGAAPSATGENYEPVEGVIRSIVQESGVSGPLYNIEVEGNNNYFANRVLVHNCQHLEAVTAGEITRLLINVPPGTMKSLLTSVFWPAWEWGPKGRPSTRVVATSHSERLAVRDNLKCRRLVASQWFQERWPLALTSDQNAKTKFENAATGFREAMPFTSLTGTRGDRVIIDDPLSVDDASSEAKRESVNTTFLESVPTRLNNPKSSAIVVVMQRLHQRDVSGLALDMGLGYEHLMLPMEFEPERRCKTSIGFTDPREADGDLLFPERFPAEVVERDKKVMGSYASAGQMQQRPAPREGGMFKRAWFGSARAVPEGTRFVRGWDLAATADSDAAYTAGVLIGKTKAGRYVIANAVRDQLSAGGVVRLMRATAESDGRACRISFPQDPGQAGKAQAQFLVRELAGFNARATPETGDKATRAEPLSAQAEAGNVDILRTGDPVRDAWIEPFLDELSVFPNGKYKDQADAASRAFSELVNERRTTTTTKPIAGLI